MLGDKTSKPPKAKRRLRKSLLLVFLFSGTVLLILAANHFEQLTNSLEHTISQVENAYQQWFGQQNTSNPLLLLPLAFMGGLLASVSPCILALLPVNLSY